VQNCQCISKSARKISRKLYLVIFFLSHTHTYTQVVVDSKSLKKAIAFYNLNFLPRALNHKSLINKEKKNILRICPRFICI